MPDTFSKGEVGRCPRSQRTAGKSSTQNLGGLLFRSSRQEQTQPLEELIPRPAEGPQRPLFCSLDGCGVLKTEVNPFRARKHGAVLIGAIADSNHHIKMLPGEFLHRLRAVIGNVDARLAHRLNRQWMNERGMRSGTRHVQRALREMAKDALGHLAARRIPGAKNQNLGLLHALPHGLPWQRIAEFFAQPFAACAACGLRARTKALMNLPSTIGAMASASTPA